MEGAAFKEDIKSIRQYLSTLDKKIQEPSLKRMKAKAAEDVIQVTATLTSLASARRRKAIQKRAMTAPEISSKTPSTNPSKTSELQAHAYSHAHGHGDREVPKRHSKKSGASASVVIPEAQTYSESARISNDALNQLLSVAYEKVKVLEQLLRM